MILIWRGKGLLVLLFAIAGPAIMMGVRSLLGSTGGSGAWIGGGLLLSALACVAVGIPLRNTHSEGQRHDLYYIPVLYYGPILLVIGIVNMFNSSGSGEKSAKGPAAAAPKQVAAAAPADSSPPSNPPAPADKPTDKPAEPAAPPRYSDVDPLAARNPSSRPTFTLREGFILRPAFDVKGEIAEAGTAFPVRPGAANQTIILSALHLLGPAGGLASDVPAAQVPAALRSLELHDAFTDAEMKTLRMKVIPLPDAAPLGSASKVGDVIAMSIAPTLDIKPMRLADAPLVRGDDVYLAAEVLGDRFKGVRLHRAIVSGFDEQGNVHYAFDTPGIELRATSGAAVLNVKGEVVAINLGGWETTKKVVGIGNPVSRFRPHLDEAMKKLADDTLAAGPTTPQVQPAPPLPAPKPAPPAPAIPDPKPVEPAPVKPVRPTPEPPRATVPTPSTPVQPDRKLLFEAPSKARAISFALANAAIRNRSTYPASLDEIKAPAIRDQDRLDPWGDAWLYFGSGKKRDIGIRNKSLLLATGNAHDGKRVVAYVNGNVETISEEAFQKLTK